MVPEEHGRASFSRKLTKKRRDSRRVSLDIPERFKDGEDAQEDVTAPKRSDTMSMNQSIFSMIARAGQQSQTDLGAMREVDSGDSDDEGKRTVQYHSLDGAARLSRLSSANDFQSPPADVEDSKASHSKHRRALSQSKLLRSLPKLKMSGKKEEKTDKQPSDQMSSSQFLPPRPLDDASPAVSQVDPPSKPKTKPTSGQDIHVEKRRGSDRKSRRGSTSGVPKVKGPVTLANRLQQIFDFDVLEEVISGMFFSMRYDHSLIL